jgi:hypothetical protein
MKLKGKKEVSQFLLLFLFHISFFPKFSLIISLSISLFSQNLKNKIFKKNKIIIKNKKNKNEMI